MQTTHTKNPFDFLGLDPVLLRAVYGLGYEAPTPIQKEAIPAILSGRDVIGTAQTGSGKTAAFLLPILQRLMKQSPGRTRALVLSPTRELAAQIEVALRGLAKGTRIHGHAVYGGVGMSPQEHALRAGVDVVVAPSSVDDPPRGLSCPAAPQDLPARPSPRERGHAVRPGLRPHEAARGPRGPAGRPSGLRRRANPRGPQSESARDGSRRIPKWTAPGPRRDRRRGPRDRRGRHLPCDQLRRADRPDRLRAPRRKDCAHGGGRGGHHVRNARRRGRPPGNRTRVRQTDSPCDSSGLRLPRATASESPRTSQRA